MSSMGQVVAILQSPQHCQNVVEFEKQAEVLLYFSIH